ncbi:hypothetical protein KTT_42750 [Tengunoibacter tsumagoiensis]|uniref:Dipeptidylpeptidase IV N-terminal domain-containing protein n=1 Tax=Tengunoibacter tsumagoiensis TaxID=2014871 RepID=A0A402A5U6_9CHLR|nr:hypothetical protein KTT_42750 [Tengunoibacter tsumagoiensis]
MTQLTRDLDVRDPAISPNGKLIAFIIHYKDYSDLAYLPATGGQPTVILSGSGQYRPNPNSDAPMSTHHWFAQPTWAPDGQHLLVLSDKEKATWDPQIVNYKSFILDLQLFSLPLSATSLEDLQPVAYANIGDGGLRDPSYRPGHADQVLYTGFKYDATGTNQEGLINLEDANAIMLDKKLHPWHPTYHPGEGNEIDPAVALTPEMADLVNMEPSFAPDGNNLIYVRRESSTSMSLYTMPVAEGVTSDPNNPLFDPNSDSNKQKGLAPYNQSSKLLSGMYLSQPVWSPDGRQIAYYSYDHTTFNLWIATLSPGSQPGSYTLKKGSAIQLTDTNGDLDADSRPCWVAG